MFVMVKLIHIGALRYTAMRSFFIPLSPTRWRAPGAHFLHNGNLYILHGRIGFGGKFFLTKWQLSGLC